MRDAMPSDAGESLIDIVRDNDALIVQAHVSPNDIDGRAHSV